MYYIVEFSHKVKRISVSVAVILVFLTKCVLMLQMHVFFRLTYKEAGCSVHRWQAHYDKTESMLYNLKQVKISFGYKSAILLLMTVIGNIPMMGGH